MKKFSFKNENMRLYMIKSVETLIFCMNQTSHFYFSNLKNVSFPHILYFFSELLPTHNPV